MSNDGISLTGLKDHMNPQVRFPVPIKPRYYSMVIVSKAVILWMLLNRFLLGVGRKGRFAMKLCKFGARAFSPGKIFTGIDDPEIWSFDTKGLTFVEFIYVPYL
jgi:hypothetical protein